MLFETKRGVPPPKKMLISRAGRILCDWYTYLELHETRKYQPNVGTYIIFWSFKEYDWSCASPFFWLTQGRDDQNLDPFVVISLVISFH